jgi:hypothetical protein
VRRDTDWVTRYDDDPGDESGGRSRPPIWVVVLVVVAVVTGVWLLFTQGFAESDPVTSPTLLPLIPVEASVVTTSTISSTDAAPVLSIYGNPPAAVAAENPGSLRGQVAVTSPDEWPFNQGTVWVFQPGGILRSMDGNVIGRGNFEYPMLSTSGRLILSGQVFDILLLAPPKSLWTRGSVFPGSGRGVVWLGRRQSPPLLSAYLWVSPVDVDSLTVGERVDVTDLFLRPVVGVADGLIVVDLEEEFAYWSPTDGLAPLAQLGDLATVVAASGNLVVVDDRRVNVLDIVSGEYVSSFERPDIRRAPTSACISPDGQHVIIVGGWTGDAVVGNITTGEIISMNDDGMSVQPEHGIGWTTDDQLVFIGEDEFGKKIVGFDLATGERFVVAELDGPEEWWLTASGTMC